MALKVGDGACVACRVIALLLWARLLDRLR